MMPEPREAEILYAAVLAAGEMFIDEVQRSAWAEARRTGEFDLEEAMLVPTVWFTGLLLELMHWHPKATSTFRDYLIRMNAQGRGLPVEAVERELRHIYDHVWDFAMRDPVRLE
jgi:hypothetical protein